MRPFVAAWFVTIVFVFFFSSLPVKADNLTFGNFEQPIPGLNGQSIDEVASQPKPITTYVGFIIDIITAVIVMVGLISMVIGAYFYMTAGGDSSRVGTAKEFIISALSGIALALTAWLILNTISGQFASDIQEPKINLNIDQFTSRLG